MERDKKEGMFMKKKVMLVFGTRPEAIKMCPIIKELKKHDNIQTVVCLTGQHKELLESVLKIFNVQADYNLNIMEKNQTLFDIQIKILKSLKEVLEKEKPNIVLVHGDTTTTFSAALACFNMKIPIGHVEAGLRTYDMYSPWPEEFNRQVVGLVAQYHFAPTQSAKENLLIEGKNIETIFVTGNTAIDSLKTTIFSNYRHKELEWAQGSRLVILTVHRRENVGQPMRNIFRAIVRVLDDHPDVKIIYPIHANPIVQEIAREELGKHDRIHIIDALDVCDFHNFMSKAYVILTDSGGIQEEAPALGKPVLVLRNVTERSEGIEAGTAMLLGTDEQYIYEKFSEILYDKKMYNKMAKAINPYGDGCASKYIVDVLLKN